MEKKTLTLGLTLIGAAVTIGYAIFTASKKHKEMLEDDDLA